MSALAAISNGVRAVVKFGGPSLAVLALGLPGSWVSGAEDERRPPGEASAAARLPADVQEIAERLERTLPPGSEARAMYDAIIGGESMGPSAGWWGISKSQRRYDWPAVRARYDDDADGRVGREEFPGTNADYQRLDYNGDSLLTERDFDWAEHPLEKTPGLKVFSEADADANGKVTRAEFTQLFDRWDEGSQGFLALNDLRDRIVAEERRREAAERHGPDIATLLKGLDRQEIGSLEPGPMLNDVAPDFTLRTATGDGEITLSDKIGEKPVVLIFGNFTCGPFRSESGNLEKLYSRYHDRAEFLMVYVREAHPTDGWESPRNARHGIRVVQPTSDTQRQEIAQRCALHLDLPMPLLVDRIDDRVGEQYSGMPNRLYLIDRDGKIAFKNGRGPFGFKTRELEQALVLLLNDGSR